MESTPSVIDVQHLYDETEREGRLFQHESSNPFDGFDLVRHAMLMQQQQPELEPSGHYYFNDDWSRHANGELQQHQSINSENEKQLMLSRQTVTRTAIVSIVKTMTSTVSCSTVGILPQCPLIGFGS